MLDETDILNLIRLNYLELKQIYSDLESNDEKRSNDAGEMVLQSEALQNKLKVMYESLSPDYNTLPKFEDYIELLERT